jgi:cytochrome oxidase Cu insertion factor (SCO1/SenC/PrrC family)
MTPLRIALVALLAVLVLGGGWLAWQKVRPPISISATTTVGTAEIGGPFELVDQTGKTRRDTDFRGRYMLVYFGYTYCPDICPTTLLIMSRALTLLGETAPDAAEQVAPLFITVDPERDTVEAMEAYAPNFHPDLVALTGTPDQVAAAAKAYRVYYAKVEDKSSGTYLMDHSSFIYLMGPDGAYLTHFDHLAQPEQIADSLKRYIGG